MSHDEPEDDRPRRRRRPRDDDDDYVYDDDRPRRGDVSGGGGTAAVAGVSVLAIVGIVVGVLFCCAVPIGIALVLPAVQKVRQAAGRAHDSNNFKQIVLGVHNRVDTQDEPPPADGEVSWRVHLLPYIEQAPLYQQFDLKQPWDGPTNRTHAAVRIGQYVSALDDPDFSQTRVRVFTGPDTLFPPGRKPLFGLREVKDGTSQTFLAVEAADAVPWPQPRELPFVKGGALPALGHPQRPTGFIVAMADGSVKFVRAGTDPALIRAAVTPNGKDGDPGF